MQLTITDKSKKDVFIALFQTLKNISSVVNIIFTKDKLHIQGMDKAHVCLYDIYLISDWFCSYEITDELLQISLDTNIFHTILNIKSDTQSIIIYTNNSDFLQVDFTNQTDNANEYNKQFKIPLIDFNHQLLDMPNIDYDAEFYIKSKRICDIFTQMTTFGDNVNIKCSEDNIDLITNSITGEMSVNIPIDDLNSFSINEGEIIDVRYSIVYINKMCLTYKLSNQIGFFISSGYPLKISYDLGNHSYINFYIAPKINNDEL